MRAEAIWDTIIQSNTIRARPACVVSGSNVSGSSLVAGLLYRYTCCRKPENGHSNMFGKEMLFFLSVVDDFMSIDNSGNVRTVLLGPKKMHGGGRPLNEDMIYIAKDAMRWHRWAKTAPARTTKRNAAN